MKSRDMPHIIRHEIRVQSREWVFRLFVLLAWSTIVVCQTCLQGPGNQENWRMVALPCSIPFVNAYLFNVLQSLFIVVFALDRVRRESARGMIEAIHVRPMNNSSYLWGKMLATILLFAAVNVVTILICLFIVDLGSAAGTRPGYYLFYFLTLNIPSLVFLLGVSLWVASVARYTFVVLGVMYTLVLSSIAWLPYRFHGTFDFLGSGVPNLFSEVTGHVNLPFYLLQRAGYLLLGIGFIFLSLGRMHRIPNDSRRIRMYSLAGCLLVLLGVSCEIGIEAVHVRVRQERAGYRESFKRHWDETTCLVRDHAITVKQSGKYLNMESDMMLYNPNDEALDSILLFLNPGLEIASLRTGEEQPVYSRDRQVIVVRHPLGGRDSVRLRLSYGGVVADDFAQLHLSDEEYEDAHRGGRFFPTGRRSAFVGDDYLLLVPACCWYPVAIPFENPVTPVYSGRDFTRFALSVVSPPQPSVFSQGVASRAGDTLFFRPSRPLIGISLCGGGFRAGRFFMDGINFRLLSFGGYDRFLGGISRVHPDQVRRCVKKYMTYYFPGVLEGIRAATWFEGEPGNLYFFETPVSFNIASPVGSHRGGQVEPGMVFWQERAFDQYITGWDRFVGFASRDELQEVCNTICQLACYPNKDNNGPSSHPLLRHGKDHTRGEGAFSMNFLWNERRVWIHSKSYPFAGNLFDAILWGDGRIVSSVPFNIYSNIYSGMGNASRVYLVGRSLPEILETPGLNSSLLQQILWLKKNDLLDRLTLNVPPERLESALRNFFDEFTGVVDFDVLAREMKARVGVDVEDALLGWLDARHEQFYRVKDMKVHEDYARGVFKYTGKVMNVGKTGGVISVEGYHNKKRDACRYSRYLKVGEAVAFDIVSDIPPVGLNTGLSSNRPENFNFEITRARWKEGEIPPYGCAWRTIDSTAFIPEANTIVVDDADPGFEPFDGNLTWFNKWFSKPPAYQDITSGKEVFRWTPTIGLHFWGDSIRSGYFKSGGSGRSKASWKTTLPEGGRYRVMAKVYRPISILLGIDSRYLKNVVYYYTVAGGGAIETVEVHFDEIDFSLGNANKWVSLGEYDFPAGEASVTLSDKEVQNRIEIPIIADAVKWVKVESGNP